MKDTEISSNRRALVAAFAPAAALLIAKDAQAQSTGVVATVPNIAALRQNQFVVVPSVVFVQGYYSPNDGGGGEFWTNPNETRSDDQGTVIVDTSNRHWCRRFNGFVSVKWFGARGDGTTDDTPAIRNALTAPRSAVQSSTPYDVYFDAGLYRVTSTLTLSSSGQAVIGENCATVYVPATMAPDFTSNSSVILWQGSGYAFQIDGGSSGTGINHVTMENIGIKGNGSSSSGVYVNYANNCQFANVGVINVANCMYFNQQAWQSKLSRCFGINFSGYGLFLDASTEDSSYESCFYAGYTSTAVGLFINYFTQVNNFLSCAFSECATNVVINLTKPNSHGHYNFISCQFEAATGHDQSSNQTGVLIKNVNSNVTATFQSCRFLYNGSSTGSILLDLQGGSAELRDCEMIGYYTNVMASGAGYAPQSLVYENNTGVVGALLPPSTGVEFVGLPSIPKVRIARPITPGPWEGFSNYNSYTQTLSVPALPTSVLFSLEALNVNGGIFMIALADATGAANSWQTGFFVAKGYFGDGNYTKLAEGSGNPYTVTVGGNTLRLSSATASTAKVTVTRLN